MSSGVDALETLLAFVLGIATASFSVSPAVVIVGGCLAVIGLRYIKAISWTGLFCIAAALFFGFIYFFLYRDVRVAYTTLPRENTASFTGVVTDEPHATERSLRFSFSLEAPYHGVLTVITSPNRDVRYGDELMLRGKIVSEEGDYVVLFPSIDARARHKGFWIKERLIDFKAEILKGFERALSPDNAALLGGITLGARSSFSPELKTAMVDSGTVHIVAVSGYNISILAIAIGNIAIFFLARRFAIWLAIGLILLFVGMVGTEASVVRAAIMGIVGLIAEKVGRPKDQAYAIVLVAACMVAWNPNIIRTDLGFGLSFLSLLGVVYLSPALRSLWRKAADRGVLEWKENMDTTIGAQLAVLPVLLGVFGKASLTSIAANILIVPTVPITMGIGFLLGVANGISPLLGFPIARIAELLTSYEIGVMHIFSRYAIPIGNFFLSPVAIAAYYGLLVAFIFYRHKKMETIAS